MSAQKSNAQAASQQQPSPAQLFRGVVKQIVSGDCVVIKSLVAKDGKNLEKSVMISNINVPRLGRRLNPNSADSVVENDQPYAFEAREFLRRKLVGKEVCFVKEASNANTDRGQLYLGRDTTTGENIAEALVSAGLAEVRRLNKPSEEEAKLVALEDHAKSQGVGKWSKDAEADHVRDVKYTLENPKNFVDSRKQKPIDAIVEYVRDGSTLRLLLLPSYHQVTVQLTGIRCPGFKREGDSEVPEPFAEEAKQFVETRLLQQDVKVVLEGVANQSNGILQGTVLHPRGNISEFLLRDGLAKCVDWSMGIVSVGPEKYRNAEKQAKQARLRLWKNYTQQSVGLDEANKNFTAKVVEVLNGDSLVLKMQDNTFKKIFLSSIRAPRLADFPDFVPNKADKKGNQLYDVPYLFETREFLRKRLIGKKVNCTVDYIQPKSNDYPEKVCCTVMIGDINVAEALVGQGLAKVIRYKQDNDQRSSKYDDLLTAESRAEKKAVGLFSSKEPATLKVADVSADANRAKQLLPILQRSGRMEALVEFVSSGSRFKLYLPKESCIITLLLTGIDCPRLGRPANGTAAAQPSEEYAEEAYQLSKSLALQREVRVDIETVDKGGNFLGQITTEDGTSIAASLVEAGYAGVYRSSSVSAPVLSQLSILEQKAKEKRLNKWKNYVEEVPVSKEEIEKNEPQERVVNQKKILITEICDDLHFYGQLTESGPKLEQLTTQLRAELEARPPVAGSYSPKVGELCVAKFNLDNEWYRAKVLSVSGTNVTVLYVDYGNKEQTQSVKLAQIPAGFDQLAPQAHEYALALVNLSSDEDDIEAAVDRFKELVAESANTSDEFSINVEYKSATCDFVTLYDSKKQDLGKLLISEGYTSVDRTHKERRLHKLFTEYLKSLAQAKSAHKNMWKYGDKEQDDAAEFGISARR